MRDDLPATLLLESAVVDDPYAFYRRLVAEAPVWQVPGAEIVVVSAFAAVTEATNRADDFSSNIRALLYRSETGAPAVVPFDLGSGSQALATADPPMHTVHRRAVFPELIAGRMAELRPEIEALTTTRFDAALSSERFEFMEAVANAIPIRVVSNLIGFRDEDPDALLDAAFASTAILAATQSLDEINAEMARTAAVFDWMNDQLERACAGSADGILATVCAAIDG